MPLTAPAFKAVSRKRYTDIKRLMPTFHMFVEVTAAFAMPSFACNCSLHEFLPNFVLQTLLGAIVVLKEKKWHVTLLENANKVDCSHQEIQHRCIADIGQHHRLTLLVMYTQRHTRLATNCSSLHIMMNTLSKRITYIGFMI
jgi:hypothetical protein